MNSKVKGKNKNLYNQAGMLDTGVLRNMSSRKVAGNVQSGAKKNN